MTSKVAIFDTNAGRLQWLGEAATHDVAIRAALDDGGYNSDVSYSFRAIDVTDTQAEALQEWSFGSRSDEYPEGLSSGTVYDAEYVKDLMA